MRRDCGVEVDSARGGANEVATLQDLQMYIKIGNNLYTAEQVNRWHLCYGLARFQPIDLLAWPAKSVTHRSQVVETCEILSAVEGYLILGICLMAILLFRSLGTHSQAMPYSTFRF